MRASKSKTIKSFNFPENYNVSKKYKIVSMLGQGWEGEVYKVVERSTGIVRAAKFFLPKRNNRNVSARRYAKKLHKLRHCPILIQYITQETMIYEGQEVTYLISDYVEGEPLDRFITRFRGNRMEPFQALHLLHGVCKGLEDIHNSKDYHGDLHTGNVIVKRVGLGFEIKLLDTYHWDTATGKNLQEDIIQLIQMFYEVLGGRKTYKNLPAEIKGIICGQRRDLIQNKFKSIRALRKYIENINWQ